jgi:hypothetical protein
VAGGIEAECLVFAQKCGANTSLSPLYAWSSRGKRAFGLAPRNWGSNVTLLASMTREGMGACVAVEGPTTKVILDLRAGGASPKPAAGPGGGDGQPLLAQRAESTRVHRGAGLRAVVPAALLAGPQPPIELALAKLKASLRRVQSRTFEALIGAMGRALDAISTRDASGFFRHCGYRYLAQLL